MTDICPLCKAHLVEGDEFGGEPVWTCSSSNIRSNHYIKFSDRFDFSIINGVTLYRHFATKTTKIKHNGLVIQEMGETPFGDILSSLTKWQRLMIMS